MYLSGIKYTKLKEGPYLHLHITDLEYSLLKYPQKVINNIAEFLNLKIFNDESCEFVRLAFSSGVRHIKITIDK